MSQKDSQSENKNFSATVGNDEEDIRPYATIDDVKELLCSLYGMKVDSVKQLNGYDDQNYHVTVSECKDNPNITQVHEAGYIFKILNSKSSLEREDHLKAQLEMLAHVSERGVVCPQHVPTKAGALYVLSDIPDKQRTGTTKHIVRLLKYIEGDLLYHANITPQLLTEGARYLGKFQGALDGFSDERLIHETYLWNMKNIHMLKPYVTALNDQHKIDIANKYINEWTGVMQKLQALPYCPIHSDFNEQNILVTQKPGSSDYQIAGILDFGDSNYGYKVFDIAVYMMYMMTLTSSTMDFGEVGRYCLEGYLQHQSLSELEYEVLFHCIMARFLQSLVMGAFYYSLYKDEYLLTTQKPGWKAVEILVSASPADWIQKWRKIAN